jgi:glycine cleavage system aminomethyltransferase T
VSGALRFLSVDGAASGAVARSAIDRAQRDLGATFEERGGWLVAASIPGEEEHDAVGIADVSAMTKIEVRPAGDPLADSDARLKPGLDTVVRYAISPKRGLVLCAPSLGDTVRAQLGERFTLDVTGQWSVIAIGGPEAATVLGRMTHIHHFPSGGEIAHVQGHVLQRDGGYWVLVPQEYGHYVWEVAVDRARALGGGPVGVDWLWGVDAEPGGAA